MKARPMTDTVTAETQNNLETNEIVRDRQGRFLSGTKPGPGRKEGSRNKLASDFISDLHDEWQVSGQDALKRMVRDDPTAFVKTVAALMPKELDATISLTEDLHLFREVRDFAQAYRLARSIIGADTI